MEIVMPAVEISTGLAMAHTEPEIFNPGDNHHPLADLSQLNAVPVIGIAHIYTDEEEDLKMPSVDLVTVFLGPNAQPHCDKFQSDLLENWKWYEFAHQALTEQPWDHLLEKAFMLFIMAESFDPSIRYVLQRANLFKVTAVVITHDPASFPNDLFPILHAADGLDFTGALRSVIGASVSDAAFGCTDLGDIRGCLRESRRLTQHLGAASAANELHLAAEQALNHFNIQDADLARANSVLVWISAGDDLVMDDYQQVLMVVDGRVSEDCQVIVALNIEPATGGEAKVVVTVGWA